MSERDEVIEAYIVELALCAELHPYVDLSTTDNYIADLIGNSPQDHAGGR